MTARTIITFTFFGVVWASGLGWAAEGGPEAHTTPPELSTISVPIRASLAPLLPELEARVPKTFSDKVKERGIDVRYEIERQPIALNMIGGGLHATTTVKYALEACRGRFPCVSCGFGEPRRVAEIKLQTKLEWDPSWRLRSTTRPLPVHYPKRCYVTWFDIDITRRFVAPQVTDQLNIAARTIDKNTPSALAIKPHAEQIWGALQAPAEIAPRTWLVLEPTEVSLTPITGSGLNVTSTLTLRALTRVVVGEKPATSRKPLPALRVANAAPGGLRVPFDLELPYGDASRLATREVAGKTFKVNGKPLTIESIKLSPAANGKVSIEAQIDYRGGALRNYRGAIFLDGTPRFDAATSTVFIPDLEYSVERRGVLFRVLERAAHASVRDRLRENARFALGPRIDEMRAEITRALNRKLAPGVFLKGRAGAMQPVSVTPLPNALSVRVVAAGVAEVELR
jgi:Domain of unknown function (DUF4403)